MGPSEVTNPDQPAADPRPGPEVDPDLDLDPLPKSPMHETSSTSGTHDAHHGYLGTLAMEGAALMDLLKPTSATLGQFGAVYQQ